jgi:Cupin
MIHAPDQTNSLTGRGMRDEAEVFRGLAPLLRVRSEIKDICRFGAQWASKHGPEARGWGAFHIVTFGGCLLDVGDQIGIALKAGDAVICPTASRMSFAHGKRSTVRQLWSEWSGACTTRF